MERTRTITISRFASANDNAPKRDNLTISALIEELCSAAQLSCPAHEFFNGTNERRREEKARLKAFSPAVFAEGSARARDSVTELHCVVLDCDEEERGIDQLLERMNLRNWLGVIHTTISDQGASKPPRCYRVVLFMDRPLAPAEYPLVWAEAAASLGVKVDQATKDVSRLYFLPAQLFGGPFESRVSTGEVLATAEVLAAAEVRAKAALPIKESTRQEGRPALPMKERPVFVSALEHLASTDNEGGFAREYETWRNAGFAICHAFGKSDEGLALFDRFSQRAKNYDRAGVLSLWKSADAERSAGITYKWVFGMAQRHGWKNPGALDTERLTEAGLARMMSERYGDRYIYAQDAGCVYARNELKWAQDVQGRCFKADYEALLKQMLHDAWGDPERLKQVVKAVTGTLERRPTMDNIRELFSRNLVLCRTDEFDSDPCLLGTENGVLDLNLGRLVTQEEMQERGAMVSRSVSVAYDPAATSPLWEAFIATCASGDEGLARYVQEAAGSCLYGNSRRRHLFLLYGFGRNGKSVFLNTLSAVLGEYAAAVSKKALLKRDKGGGGGEYELARLPGVRLVTCSETSSGEVLDDAQVKQLTGGDRMTVRMIFQRPCEISPRFTVLLATNHKPIIRDASDGMWDRLRLVPFTARIPDEQVDPLLSEKLLRERAGILNWLLAGYRRWQGCGMALPMPDAVRIATEEYRREMDTIGLWLEECCVCTPGATGPAALTAEAAELHASYVGWCGVNNLRGMAKQAFARQLTERGFNKRKTRSANLYEGIALRDEAAVKAEQYRQDLERSAVSRAH
jgi:P4 family phage/plasmid primase-like protien